MNRIWVVVVIFSGIFLGSYFYSNYIEGVTSSMIENTHMAYSEIDIQFENSLNYINDINSTLTKHEMFFCAFVDRKLLNQVQDELVSCMELHNLKNKDKLKLELRALEEKIVHIKENVVFDLKNIL